MYAFPQSHRRWTSCNVHLLIPSYWVHDLGPAICTNNQGSTQVIPPRTVPLLPLLTQVWKLTQGTDGATAPTSFPPDFELHVGVLRHVPL